MLTGVAIPTAAAGLRLHRIARSSGEEVLISCEGVRFVGGASAVETTLRRAALSGRVEVDGDIDDHFADVLDGDGDIIETVALDADSYRALKTKWMRCRVESPTRQSREAARGR